MADVKEKTEAKTDKSKWSFDTSEIKTMKQIRTFQEGLQSARFKDVYELCTKIIKTWPYGGDPSNIEAYDDLAPLEYTEVTNEVSTALGKLFQPATT